MKTIALTTAIQMLIQDSKSGIRVQKNGKKLSLGTIDNYLAVLQNVLKFETKFKRQYFLKANTEMPIRSNMVQHNYWNRFYRDFRKFLFVNCNVHDNYVVMHMKVLKLTFRYLRKFKFFPVGNYEHIFYCSRLNCNIHIFPIELLGIVIHSRHQFDLNKFHKYTLDVFLFGISIGLRYSDLKLLQSHNIVNQYDGRYLQTISKKTMTPVLVKLPDFAIDILNSLGNKTGLLFDLPDLVNFNDQLKRIAKRLNWNWPVQVFSSKYGIVKILSHKCFYDIISSRMMRRTTITALLMQGVNESAVRLISGHADGSKEFYRYVQFSQQYVDSQTDKAWNGILALNV